MTPLTWSIESAFKKVTKFLKVNLILTFGYKYKLKIDPQIILSSFKYN